uniref:RAD21 cohesin complex component like 1 n=1 Tax=Cyanoderma ruficeps TaxID=181631 RepID=A0A8C3QTG1_9PASS
MFYVNFLINKRGPLAKIWLAAHWEKKLTKAHIFECNLEVTVQKILSPKFDIALRTSGHLLLGLVRIYHRKAKYLLGDCSEALTKMKTAFRPGLLDLPEENFEAAYQSITLPEEFHDFEAPLPDVKAIDVAEHFTLNQSRAEEITLAEDYESNEEADALRRQSFFEGSVLTSSNSLVADPNSASTSGDKSVLHEDVYCFQDDHFGDEDDAADMIGRVCHGQTESSNCADTMVKNTNHTKSETTILFQEEEFVLEPVDDAGQKKKKQKKRKLLVDVEKELSCQTIYKQLTDCTDLLGTLDLAPPTKKMMMWKEWGGADKLLSHAAHPVVHAQLQKVKISSLWIEEPSYLQEPAHSETERKIRNDSFMLTSQNDRNETNENCGEMIQLKRSGVCSFSFWELCRRNNRKEAAATFYIFLVLKKQLVLQLWQHEPFADLTATAGPMFDKIR